MAVIQEFITLKRALLEIGASLSQLMPQVGLSQ